MRIELDIGLYQEHFKQALKWYNLAFGGDKSPAQKDQEVYHLFNLIISDLDKQDKEWKEENDG